MAFADWLRYGTDPSGASLNPVDTVTDAPLLLDGSVNDSATGYGPVEDAIALTAIYDFGTPVQSDRLRCTGVFTGVFVVNLNGSNDGAAWTGILAALNHTNASATPAAFSFNQSFAAASYRYWQVVVTGYPTAPFDNTLQFTDFRLYDGATQHEIAVPEPCTVPPPPTLRAEGILIGNVPTVRLYFNEGGIGDI